MIVDADRTTITGSRATDRAIFLMLAALAIVGSWRMRVYFKVTVAEVRATRIDADGSRHELGLPANFARIPAAQHSPNAMLDDLAARMELFARHEPATSRIQWTVRYSFNSSRLDHVRVYVFPGGQ
jgi:hypothetical protein